jgi:hypothetical protein
MFLIHRRSTKTYVKMKEQFHSFITSKLDGCVLSFTPLPLYFLGKSPIVHWVGDWVGLRIIPGAMMERNLLPLPGIELRFPRGSSHSTLSIQTEVVPSPTEMVVVDFSEVYTLLHVPILCRTQVSYACQDSESGYVVSRGKARSAHRALMGKSLGSPRRGKKNHNVMCF